MITLDNAIMDCNNICIQKINFLRTENVREYLSRANIDNNYALAEAIKTYSKNKKNSKHFAQIIILDKLPIDDGILIGIVNEYSKEWRHDFGRKLRKRYNFPINCLLKKNLVGFEPFIIKDCSIECCGITCNC
ncbi:hypothetical protein SAMN05660649_00021 [Desulfotomaculum arcticum]|uniref:Uncharacterized protein n=1 Tax=Desulfotruncus arcticus DSM 17038 TaxID=1121424 RepID=A0A1I2MSQ1_9FIRM|nr:hypothetical protein [Desulfotruncus arcticus]SFF92527.1 hypothetical protein SAMN05660649_00021 [Desulfotomaculum arcticum] [Desulfotruncus arcticus DSM 17038]